MEIKYDNNRVYFNYFDKSYANITMKEKNVCLELLKTLPRFRNQSYATKLLQKVMDYILKRKEFTHIYLNPLPLESDGLNLEQLIGFYKKHGFKSSDKRDIHMPYLMVKRLED